MRKKKYVSPEKRNTRCIRVFEIVPKPASSWAKISKRNRRKCYSFNFMPVSTYRIKIGVFNTERKLAEYVYDLHGVGHYQVRMVVSRKCKPFKPFNSKRIFKTSPHTIKYAEIKISGKDLEHLGYHYKLLKFKRFRWWNTEDPDKIW